MFGRFAALALLLAALATAQTRTTGTISGVVYDSQSGRPVPGVAIAINGQSDDRNVSDQDGKFTISLSPGSYTLKLSAERYAPLEIADLVVKAGENTESSAVLSNLAVGTSVDVVERVGAVEASAEAMLQERRLTAVVSDSISRSELASGTSGNAAGALEKVTGVSVVGDGFVFVRGLGERYSSTQLNGAVVPTTEPEKRVVSLDLFPTGMIENIRIAKTYSPDLPAEFSGGLVQMQTVEFPTQRGLSFSTKTGFNTLATFNPFQTWSNGGNDFWGFGRSARALPSIIPADRRLFQGQFSPSELQTFGQSFLPVWDSVSTNARPALDWSAAGGGTWGRLGLVGAISFSNKPQRQKELQRYIREGAGKPLIFTDYPDYNEYSEIARMGGVFNAALKLSANHKLVFRNTFTHEAEKSAREFSGYDGGLDTNLKANRLRYVERGLFATGAEGDHSVPKWRNSVFHWQFTYSKSSRDEPDLREIIRNLLPDGRYSYSSSGSSGIRFFSALGDRIYEPQGDYSIPFYRGSFSGIFKLGMRTTIRRRDFQARRFLYTPIQRTTLDLFAPGNVLFSAANIRPTGFQISEFTRATDTYNAEMDIWAGYAMVDMSFGGHLRVQGGVRVEDSEQNVITFDNRIPNARPVNAGLKTRDPAPAVNVIYALNARQNLRISWSNTVSRPDFRELSPFDFNNTLGGFVTAGNPNLQRAKVKNYDVRWELFPGGNQILAVSFFGKTFDQPIEQTIVPSNDLRQTFVNAKGARNLGFEVEFRRSLASISTKLRDFGVSSNFTFVDSNIEIKPQDATIVTSQSRPLLGQSRYLANAIVEWKKPRLRSDARFFVNYVSRRVSDVGTFRVPDIYQEGNTVLDFAYQYLPSDGKKWSMRFEAENLTDNHYHWTQGPFLQRSYRTGRTFQIGLNYTIF